MCTHRLCAGSWAVWFCTSDYMLGQVHSTPTGMTIALNVLSYSLANFTEAKLRVYA